MSKVNSVELVLAARSLFDLIDSETDAIRRASLMHATRKELRDRSRDTYGKCAYDLVAQGHTYGQAADLLGISRRTVIYWATDWAIRNGQPKPVSPRTALTAELEDAIEIVDGPLATAT